jgi:hypothetical protein
MGFQHVKIVEADFDSNMGGAPALVGKFDGHRGLNLNDKSADADIP